MKLSSIRSALMVLMSTGLLLACKKDDPDNVETLRGAEVTMGNGKASSFITINSSGVPQEIGVEMTAAALTGLTMDPMNFAASTFLMQLDQRAKDLTPFDHIVMNWSPHGHDPANVFTVPHFDIHFYIIPMSDRMAIPPYTPSTAAQHDNLPPAGFMPTGFQASPGGVPQMGKHWIDQNMTMPFSHTMVYGSYNGKFTFVEPMILKTILESGQSITTAYNQPTQFQHTGKYYPTTYKIYKDASTNKHYVSLSGFVLR